MRRVRAHENANAVAAEQIRALLRPPARRRPGPAVRVRRRLRSRASSTLAAWTAHAVAVLVRLRTGRCFYADPAQRQAAGRPAAAARAEVRLRRPAHLVDADARALRRSTRSTAAVRVRAWAGLHAKTAEPSQPRHPRAPTPIVRGTLSWSRSSGCRARPASPSVLWLWWRGPGARSRRALAGVRPPLRPGAHLPLLQADRSTGPPRACATPSRPTAGPGWWSRAYTQLRLARAWVADRRLPWERPLDARPPHALPRAPRPYGTRCRSSARPPARRNPAAARRAGPRAAVRGPRRASRPSRRRPDTPNALTSSTPHGRDATPCTRRG